jgi:vitamin B12 transporter
LPAIHVESATISVRPAGPSAAPAPDPSQPEQAKAADAATGIPLDQVGSAVSVVTGQDLQRQQVRTVHEALRSLPGVSVSQSGGPGSQTAVRLRGAESRHTLVVIDGVEVNTATDGAFDFSNLSAADIERIEVLRGPQSGLYGSGAIGGVVNITTKSGRGPLSLVITNEAGTQGSSGTSAQVSGGTDAFWGSLLVQRRHTDGFNVSVAGSEDDGSTVNSFAFRGGVALSNSFKVETSLREHNTRAEYDQGFGGVFRGFDVPKDESFLSDARLRVGSLLAALETFDKAWIHKFQLSGAETVRDDFASTFTETISTNQKVGYTSTLHLGSPGSPFQHFVTGLLERRVETFEQPTTTNPVKREMERNSVAGEIRGEYFKSLFVTASLRHDDNDFFQDFTTWNVNASYKIPGSSLRLHSGVGTGVKYPGFADLFGTFDGFEPNKALAPEESFGHDLGIEATLLGGRAVLDVTYFNTDLTNEIDIDCTFPPLSCKPFNRSGPSTRRGVEVSGRYLVAPNLSIGGAYTYLDAREEDGREEVRRAPHTGRLDVSYTFQEGRGGVTAAAVYNGTMKDLAFPVEPPFERDRVNLDPYWLITVAGFYKLQPGVEIFGRVENLLDQHYQEVFGFNATPGVAAFAGLRLTFGGPDGVEGARSR